MKVIWMCMKEVAKVCENISNEVPSLSTWFLNTNLIDSDWKFVEIAYNVWKVCELCVRMLEGGCECMKVSPMRFPAQVKAFWYPHIKIGSTDENSPKCVKSVWECVKEWVRVCRSISNELPSLSICFLMPTTLKLA